MATGYIIDIGYNGSGEGFQGSYDEMWEILKREARSVANQPVLMWDNAILHLAPAECPCGNPDCDLTLADVCEAFTDEHIAAGSNAYEIHEKNPDNEDDYNYIHMIAAGSRALREHACRAFCRLVMQRMHEHFIEININVG